MPTTRKILFVSLVLTMALLLSVHGCANRVSPLAIAAEAISASVDVASFTMERSGSVAQEFTGGPYPGKLALTEDAKSLIDLSKKQLRATTIYSGEFTGGETTQDITAVLDIYTVDGWSYMKGIGSPAGESWLKTKLTDNLWASQSQFAQHVRFLKEAKQINLRGSEMLNGADTYVLEIKPNTDTLAGWLLSQSEDKGLGLISFNLPDSLGKTSVKAWIAKDTYLLARMEVSVLIEIRPGDIPGLLDNFDKMTMNVYSQVTLHDYGTQVAVTVPQEASLASETAYDQLGLPEYMSYLPQQLTTPPTTETPAPPTEESPIMGAKIGDTVKVHYTGRLADGTVFDSSLGREPLEFTLGQGQMIPGFEQAVIGMQVGESKTVTIPAEQAYGSYNNELIYVIGREKLPEGLEPTVGQRLYAGGPDGQTIIVTVIEVTKSSITVDANHYLAGKDLTFEIEVIEIQ